MFKLAMRTVGMILGLLAAILMLTIEVLYSLARSLAELAGHGTANTTYFFIGFIVSLAGMVGAFLADPLPIASVVMMLGATVAFFFLVGAWALIPAIFFVIASVIVFVDRGRRR